MAEQVNIFHKGISSDLDYSKRDNQSWDFPTLNMRIFNKEGQGYIATNLDGNTLIDGTHPEGEAFFIKSQYKIIGACEYNGIAYIFSFNESSLLCEIGCYPSPNTLDYSGPPSILPVPSFERVYRPLNNYVSPSTTMPPYDVNSLRTSLNTDLFEWDSQHQISVFAREDYDGSVNLYFCDYKNPNRVVNSGFNQDGFLNHRLYNETDFFTSMNMILSTGNVLTVELKEISSGGSFKYGNIIFYFQYLTLNFDATAFITESNACQIFKNDLLQLRNVEGGKWDEDSDKQVIFNISNIDPTYPYIQVAYTRYYSDYTGVQLSETFLIDKKFSTVGITEITITGHESVIPLDPAEIIKNKSVEVTCKTLNHLNNMSWGANWKDIDIDYAVLKEFAQLITLKYDDSLAIDGTSYFNNEGGSIASPIPINNRKGQYKDYFKTYYDAGYFRIETYPFAITYELNSGTLTEAFPVKGYDELTGTTNNLGLYRFPAQSTSVVLDGTGHLRIMGITFDMTTANLFLSIPSTALTWMKKNVRAIYFMRSNRDVNLKYQGLMMNVCKPYTDDTNDEIITNNCNSYFQGYPFFRPPWSDSSFYNFGHHMGQVPAKYSFYAGGSGPISSPWWNWICNATGGSNNNWEHGASETYHINKPLIPIYRGNVAMMYTLDGDPVGQTAPDHIANYVSRWPLYSKHYAFYSPDDIYNISADFTNCNYLHKVSDITFYDHNVGPLLTPWGEVPGSINDVYPKTLLAETTYLNSAIPLIEMNTLNQNANIGKGVDSIYPSGPITLNTENYVNAAKDIWEDEFTGSSDCIYNIQKLNTQKQYWSNRSIQTCPYQAIQDTSIDYMINDYNHSICNVYISNPTTINIVSNWGYDLSSYSSVPFYRLSQGIKLFSDSGTPLLNNTYTYYKGDCYLQRTYFKQVSWNCSEGLKGAPNGNSVGCLYTGSDTAAWDYPDTGSSTRHTYGTIIGIITENVINTAMRYSTNSYDYYPHASLWDYAITPPQIITESNLLNSGHNAQLGQKEFMGYNDLLPYHINKKPTRIRHSNYHVPYSYIDGYRLWDVSSFKDYDLRYGQIHSLQVIDDTLISYQEGTINQHYSNEQQLKTPTISGDLILGTGPILSQQVSRKGEYGTKHQWSVVKGTMGLYSWDWDKRTIIKISTGTVGGQTGIMSESISMSKLIEEWIYDMEDSIDPKSDIMAIFPDNPVNYTGIVSGVDRKFNEIYFTVHRISHTSIVSKTLVYNEKINAFTGQYSIASPFYLNINNDMYSQRPIFDLVSQPTSELVYLHNIETAPSLTFYNNEYPFQLSYIINGSGVAGGILTNKLFLNNEIEMSHHLLNTVTYTTEYQTSIHNWALMAIEYWQSPEYLEHKWKFPISLQTSIANDAFEPNTNMRGTWMKTTLEYLGTDKIFIKNAITSYIPSKT